MCGSKAVQRDTHTRVGYFRVLSINGTRKKHQGKVCLYHIGMDNECINGWNMWLKWETSEFLMWFMRFLLR